MAPPQAGHAGDAAAAAAAAAADADSNADGMRDHHCARLRSLVQDCIAKHLYGSAVFYADKLLVLSGGAPADVYLLAQAMYVARQPLRALALLKAPPTVRGATQQQQQPHPTHEPPPSPLLSDARFAYLAAKCAAAAGEWHEALVLLGSEDGAEAELEALERAWAPALAAAAARAGAVAGGVQGADNEGAAAANPDAAAAAARTGTGGAAARGSSAGAAAAAGGGGRRSTGGGATSAAAAASAQARRRSSAGGAGGVQQQQQRHQASTSPTPADNHPPLLLPPGAAPASGTEVRLSSAVCLLRGRGYLALDDRARAARWLRAALLRDPFCEDAFALLVDGALLAAPQEVELVMALPLRPEDEWLRLMYRARCKQYGPGQERELDEVLDELQRPYAPDGRPALAAGQRGGGGNEEEQGAAAAMPMSPPTVPAGGRQSARQRRSSAGGAQQQQQQVTFASPPPQSAGAHPPQPLPLMTPATAEMAEAGPSPPPTIAVPTRSVGTKRTQTKQAKLGGQLRDMGGGSGTPPQATTTAGPLRGWGLGGCSAVLACRAARLLHLGRYAECLAHTTALLARDAHAESALLPPHLAAALALGRKDELFLR
jgi:anaphase-promoting complex subunit 6